MSREKQAKLKGFKALENSEVQSRKFILMTGTSVSTNVAGLMNTVIPMDPSGAVNWGEISTYYDEFRVIGINIYATSKLQYSVTATNNTAFAVFDNDDSGVITSVAAAYAYTNKYIFPAIWQHTQVQGDKGHNTLKMSFARPVSKTSPIPWVDCAAPAGSLGAIKFSSEALDASTTYLHVVMEWFVEARGRR